MAVAIDDMNMRSTNEAPAGKVPAKGEEAGKMVLVKYTAGSRLLKTPLTSQNYALVVLLTKDSHVPVFEEALSKYEVLHRVMIEQLLRPGFESHPLHSDIPKLRDQHRAVLDFTRYSTADVKRLVSYLYYGAFSTEEDTAGADKRWPTQIYFDMYILARENGVEDLAKYSRQQFATYLLFPAMQESCGDYAAMPQNLQTSCNILMRPRSLVDEVEVYIWQQTLRYVTDHQDVRHYRDLIRVVVFVLLQIKDVEVHPLVSPLHQYLAGPFWAPELSSCQLVAEVGTQCEYCERRKDVLLGCLHELEACTDCRLSEICRQCWWLGGTGECVA